MSTAGALRGLAPTGSSSRKRPYADITRSESRSRSPEVPSKRRRQLLRSASISSNTTISSAASPSPSLTSSESDYPLPSPQRHNRRHSRNGLDLRRPIMTTSNIASHTIDLTADDDDDESPAPTRRTRVPVVQSPSPLPAVASPSPMPNNYSWRGPPFGNRPVVLLEVSDSDEDDPDFVPSPLNNQTNRQPPARISSSPEVEFVGERPVQPNPGIHPASRRPHVTTQAAQQPPGDRETISEMFLRGTQFMLQTLNPATFIGNRPFNHQGMPIDPAVEPADNFDDLRFNYQQPAFEMGTRESETPQITSEPYKAPSSAEEGFTRDLDEDEILVCPHCGDELAAGDWEVKQQVWIVKQCGHVYCGACATNRSISKGGKRDKKNIIKRKSLPFRVCAVEGCTRPVTTKGSMFQIYL